LGGRNDERIMASACPGPVPALPLDQRIGRALLQGRDDEGVVAVEDGRVVACTRFAAELLKCDPAAAVGATAEAFVGALGGELLQLHFRSLLLDSGPSEFVAPRPYSEDEWIEVRSVPLSPGVAFLLKDVTARELSDRTLRLLVHELNHRVKNMLSTVQSVARQSLQPSDTVSAARDFEDRLMALGWTYDLLTQQRWTGASLKDVVRRTLSPHLEAESPRLQINGPDLWLEANRVLSFALALHELATNAVKYGALSNESGRVSVAWRVDPKSEGRLDFEWRETGGPPVRTPRRRGFGSRLIERSLARELGGEANLTFDRSGLRCRISAPMMRAAPTERPG